MIRVFRLFFSSFFSPIVLNRSNYYLFVRDTQNDGVGVRHACLEKMTTRFHELVSNQPSSYPSFSSFFDGGGGGNWCSCALICCRFVSSRQHVPGKQRKRVVQATYILCCVLVLCRSSFCVVFGVSCFSPSAFERR